MIRRITGWAVRLVMHPLWRLTRGMTLGVRAVVIDGEGRVLLVEHTYVPGWHLPGGGVEHGETALDAVTREVTEEAAVRPTAPPEVFGLYANFRQMAGDHVVLYVVRDWEPAGPARKSLEIARAEFFAADNLPQAVTAGTRRRIEEVLAGRERADVW